MKNPTCFALLALALVACSASATDEVRGDEANITGEATLSLTSDFQTNLTGTPKAGGTLRVDYALDRLPKCRGNVGGAGPAWNITGFYSANGALAKTFEVTTVTPDGKDRVAKAANIPLTSGGDLAVWFQGSSSFGCSEFDSQYGQNFHVQVAGDPPTTGASLVFAKDGTVEKQGTLRAGGRVKVRYEQDRLPECRRVQAGIPQWTISGYASLNGKPGQTFQTGRPEGSERVAIDAVVDLPGSGELSLWFDVTNVGGCHEVDNNGGGNYRFSVE